MGWFTNLLDRMSGVITEKSEDYVLAELTDANGDVGPRETIVKDRDYVTISVRSYRIVDVRKLATTFYGSVQSRAHYFHASRGEVDYQRVVVPEMSGLDTENVDRFVVVDKPVLGPVPYIGGLSLELGLFSVKGSDLAEPYLKLLSEVAEQAGVAVLSTALPFVNALRTGAELLFGNDKNASLEIGVSRSWENLSTGVWLLARIPKKEFDVSRVRFSKEDGHVTDGKGKRYPYLVFSISRSDRRDDWMLIPELKSAWEAIGRAAIDGKTSEVEQLFETFQRVVRWSPDLVPADAQRLTEKARDKLAFDKQSKVVTYTAPVGGHRSLEFEALNLYDD